MTDSHFRHVLLGECKGSVLGGRKSYAGVLSISLISKAAEGLKEPWEELAVQLPRVWEAESNTWTTGCRLRRLSRDLAVSDIRGDCCHQEPGAPREAQVRGSLEADGSGEDVSGQLVLHKQPHLLDACLFSDLWRSSVKLGVVLNFFSCYLILVTSPLLSPALLHILVPIADGYWKQLLHERGMCGA